MSTTLKHIALLLAFATPSVWIAACSSDKTTTSAASDSGPTSFSPSPGLSSDAGPQPEASEPEPQGQLRIAQLSPDFPAIDICVAPHGTQDFTGPLLAQTFSVDGGLVGIGYGQVSGYFSVPVGQYDVRIVAAGSPGCVLTSSEGGVDGGSDAATEAGDDGGSDDASIDEASTDAGSGEASTGPVTVILGPDITNLPAIAENGVSTLLIAGLASPSGGAHGLTFSLFDDDVLLAGGGASLRAVNALATADTLDFGLGSSSSTFVPLLVNVGFGKPSAAAAPTSGATDPHGYMPIAPFDAQMMSARAGATSKTDVAITQGAHIPLGSIATIFAIGGASGDTNHPPAMLVCIDNAQAGSPLADCSVSP